MKATAPLFDNIAQKDYLGILDKGVPKYNRVADLLGFEKRDVAQATGLPVSKIRLDTRVPVQVVERFREWAVAMNLVGQFFEGQVDRTSLWFTTSNPLLGDISPRDMLRLGRFQRLYEFIVDALSDNEDPLPPV